MPMNTTASADGIVREPAHAMVSLRDDLRGLPADPDDGLSHRKDTRG